MSNNTFLGGYIMNDYEINSGFNGKGLVGIGIIVGIIIAILIFMTTYNSLVDMEEDVKLARANIENAMQRRLELIPDLVEVVKNYAKHEEKIYEDIANAREALTSSIQSGDVSKINEANAELSRQVDQLLVIAESYPQLTAGAQYISLMDQLEGSVNRISVARDDYNEVVSKYNRAIRKFPGSILAGMFGFEQMEQFEADPEAERTNMVDWGNDSAKEER